MMRSKFACAFIFGVCLTVFSSAAAFAGTGAAEAATAKVQAGVKAQPGEGMMNIMEGSAGSGISGEVQPAAPVSEAMLKKQDEINKYLFEQHKDEIKQLGFTVTHTAPFENYVEIGITPYNETNAKALYNVFGRDMVKIVEGAQAVTLVNQTTASNTVGSKIAESAEAVSAETTETDPQAVHGRDGEPEDNERGQIYTASVVSAPVDAPEMAVNSAVDSATHQIPAAIYIAAAAVVLTVIAAVFTRKFKAVKS